MDSKPLTIDRILFSPMRGSSRPVLVDTLGGKYLVKLRGAAQGTGVLVAEIIVARLAEVLNLPVLPHTLLVLEENTPTEDRDAELKDLLAFSVGVNLGFPLLDGARVVGAIDCAALTPQDRSRVLWLDRFVFNPDRTSRNPNILLHRGKNFLIDHGAALRFQYDWSSVTERTPRQVGLSREPHLFEEQFESDCWMDCDIECTARMTRSTLIEAVNAVPDCFLVSLLPSSKGALIEGREIIRRRAAYVAFLWKRLAAPRAFATGPAQLSAGSVSVSG